MEIPGYAIQNPIGHGGMATVYLAIQRSLERQVVLKVLNRSVREKSVVVDRFLNEGRIVATLRHPNIITIYDVGVTDDYAYISMEYIEGGDLKARLDSVAFTTEEALRVLEQVASGLAVAHRHGIVHRDVKPGNILFRADGTAVLSDFGIAKQLTTDANLTATGMFVGSPNYMAPEQAESGPIDGRTDIYALGVLLFEMLTRRKPYVANSIVDVILKHQKEPIPLLPEHQRRYQELINLMLAKRRGDRFRDVDSLLHYLKQLPPAQPAMAAEQAAMDATIEMHDRQGALSRVTRVRLPPRRRPPVRIVLYTGLIVTGLAYLAVEIAVYRINRIPDRPPVTLSTELEMIAAPPPPAIGDNAGAQPDATEVLTALNWLARNSLDEYRLTAPPKDNAYYYYSRLLQIDPDNATALAGFKEIGNRFARLAEQAIAEHDSAKAQTYIALGLQIDPANETLRAVQPLAEPQQRGPLAALFEWFL